MALINQIDIAIRANLPAGTLSLYESLIQFVPLSILLAITTALLIGWLVWKSSTWWLNWAWVQKCRSSASRRALPKAEKFSIAIAILEGDEKDIVRTQLLDALRDLVGMDALRFDRQTNLVAADNPRIAEAENHKKAQSWLVESKAHVLIWGQIMSASGPQTSTLRLHFTTRDTEETGSIRLAEQQVFEFPVIASEPLAAVVRSQVLAQLGKFQPSHPVAEALQVEITLLQNLVDAWPKGSERAAMQGSLGSAWQTVGLQTGQALALQNSITAYREALKELTRERVPLDWAAIQNNLGGALRVLGVRENGTARLEEAVVAFQEALKERTREVAPMSWAATQNNLGNVLSALGSRDNNSIRIIEATTAYKEALKVYTCERAPLNWAATKCNLGANLRIFGERAKNSEILKESVTAYQDALKVYTRKDTPLNWATTKHNLGNVLRVLGEKENNMEFLEAAITALQEALKVRTQVNVPLDWAMTQNSIGATFRSIYTRSRNPHKLQAAVNAYEEALKERRRDRVPLDWAATQNNLGSALCALGIQENDVERFDAAVIAYKYALSEYEKQNNSYYWGVVKRNINLVELEITKRK
jgi:tetratricopeptide (TPR) repeat protein